MSVFIASVILIALSSAGAILLKRKLAETFFLSMFTVVLVIYCAGLLNCRGSLLVGLSFVVLLAVLSLAYCVRKSLKNIGLFQEIDFARGLLLFLIFMGFSLYLGYNAHWHAGDEFNYWGIAVKHMYFMDAFTTSPSDVGLITIPGYLPGTAILHYFFTRFSGVFSEYPAYVSMDILYFSLIMPLLKDIFTPKGVARGLLLAVAFLFLPIQWTYHEFSALTTLSVDPLIGSLFGMTVIYYFLYQYEKSVYGVLIFSGATFLLVLSKDIGLVLAMVACLVAFADIVLFRRADINAMLAEKSLQEKLRTILWLLLPAILSGFAIVSWKIICHFMGVRQHPPSVSFSNVIALLTNKLDDAQRQTVKHFFDCFFTEKINNPYIFTTASFTLLFIVTALLLAYLFRSRIKLFRSITAVGMMICGLGLYEGALLLVYIFSFNGGAFSEFYRYNSPYMLGSQIFLLLFFLLPKEKQRAALLKRQKKKKRKHDYSSQISPMNGLSAGLTVVLGILMLFHINQIFIFPLTNKPYGRDKNYFMTFVGDTRRERPDRYLPRNTSVINKYRDYITIEPSKQVNIISQDEMGWWRARMMDVGELYPHAKAVDQRCVTIGIDIPDDLPSWPPPPRRFSPEEWEEYILSSGSSLLYVDISDEPFVNSYGQFFSDGVTDNMLYRVQNNDGHMLLVPVVEENG